MLKARAIERQNLPTAGDGEWELLHATERDGDSHIEVRTEYFNRGAAYRIVSRILGRGDYFVRLSYQDYDCQDVRFSTERSEPWISSLCLRDGAPE